MNNEEKILSILESIQAEQRQTNGRLDSMEAEQRKTNDRLTVIEDAQARLEVGKAKMESELEFVRDSVVRIEQVHGKKLDALFDGHQQLKEQIDDLKEHVSLQDEDILKRVFPKAMEK